MYTVHMKGMCTGLVNDVHCRHEGYVYSFKLMVYTVHMKGMCTGISWWCKLYVRVYQQTKSVNAILSFCHFSAKYHIWNFPKFLYQTHFVWLSLDETDLCKQPPV